MTVTKKNEDKNWKLQELLTKSEEIKLKIVTKQSFGIFNLYLPKMK